MNILENIFLSKPNRDILDIDTVEQFHAVLKRERFRSDRINKTFCLVLFNITNKDEFSVTVLKLVNLSKSKIRDFDELGWFDENRIGLLLPEISMKNATKVAGRIISNFENNKVIEYNIISYPSAIKGYESNNHSCFNIDLNLAISDGYIMPLWKRAFDIIFSLVFLIILSPVMLLTALFIKIVSPGPVFFRQERVGQAGKIFNLLKFRTMTINNDDSVHREYLKKLITAEGNSEQPMVKIDNDGRIIILGKILRKTCIDELPQFINVLLGDMSIVGPRPCIPYEAEEFLHWHKRRFDIVPGITGLWQVSGKNKTTFKEMIRYDIEYAKNRSLLLDLKIILKTPGVIIGQVFEDRNNRNYFESSNLTLDTTSV